MRIKVQGKIYKAKVNRTKGKTSKYTIMID